MANPSTAAPTVSNEDTKKILETILHPDMKNDPYAFVMYIYPWGQRNTPLANVKGPRKWQVEELCKIRDHIKENIARIQRGESPLVYKCAIASGRGPGKSAFAAWITHWFMSCVIGGSAIVSANTDPQLTSKTFGEIGKWLTLALNGYWFDKIQKKVSPKPWFAEQIKNALKIDSAKYYCEGILWNEDDPDAFAGEHSNIGVLLLFDEASGIPKVIYDVSDGFFTDLTLYRFWFCFSNPRKNTGPFFECFHAHRAFWNTRQIDSRSVEGLDQSVYNEIIAKNGVESDEAKKEVYGQFPSQGDAQFISRKLVEQAQQRVLDRYDDHAALVMGVDPARFGDDSTVIRFRRGRDARSAGPTVEMKGLDNMKVANKVADLIDEHNPDGVFIDSGAGAGIIDRLKERGYKVFEVAFGGESQDKKWEDHRTEIWGKMRDWLPGAMIDGNQFLADDLVGPEYEFKGAEDRIKLESKEKMKKRGVASPNHADALAVTFHLTIPRHDSKLSRKNPQRAKNRVATGMDYKIFGGQR